MELITKNIFRLLCLISILTTLGESHEWQTDQHLRKSRSIKDALPKDDEYSQSRVITDMRHKIFSLENSMKKVTGEVEQLSKQNEDIEQSMLEQKTLVEKIDTEFSGLQKLLSTHSDLLSDIEKITSPAENLFALSNQTCGGVLVGQSGSIVFSRSSSTTGSRNPSSCVWTVRANNRAVIKVSTHASYRTSYSSHLNTYVLEIIKPNVTGRSNSSQPLQTKISKLQKSMHHVFAGPSIFIVTSLVTQIDIDLHIQFEGMGKLVEKDTFFTHETLQSSSGSFHSNELETWSPSLLAKLDDNTNYTLDHTTIVVSNFCTKVHLQAAIGNGGCSNVESFMVITDVMENSTVVTDCCKTNCEGKNSLINYDNPFVILITKKFQRPFDFNLTWKSDPPYPSSSNSRSGLASQCGEILGGTTGTIMYKPHVSYRNSERCVWVIVPQPRPRSSIVINVGTNGIESTYDHLYMVELTDVNGAELSDAPRITRLGRYGTYEALSREVYIVFYSDSSVSGYGFSLTWRATGEFINTGNDVTTQFTIFKMDDGSATSMSRKSTFTSNFYQVFIFTPVVPTTYSYGLQLQLNQTLPVATGNDCIHEEFSIFTAVDGLLSKATLKCDDPGVALLQNADGLTFVVMNSQNASSEIAMNFKWRQEFGKGNSTDVVVEDDNCGGVIKGERGVLKYKIGTDYVNNERCVWLLHSPNSTNITLKLLKDGFESCCDSLLVNTIDPENGSLRNDTVPINRSNRTRTFDESVLVIVFRSDSSTRGKGFAIQFSSGGNNPNPRYSYKLRHRADPYGTIDYPSSDWGDGDQSAKNEILVIASSLQIGAEDDPFTMPTNMSWSLGTFKKANQTCDYGSITFYTTPEPDGWLTREKFPNPNDTTLCPDVVNVPAKKNICSTIFSAFLAVFKPIPAEPNSDNETSFRFTYEKSAGCGGVYIGNTGEISYKEDGKYANSEKCIWLVEVPQAETIAFTLERNGFEDCCDYITVSPVDAFNGVQSSSVVISSDNRTTSIKGPVAIVTFSSDSSVTGSGFRLSFRIETQLSSDLPYTYNLVHHNQPRQNEFSYQVEPNQVVVVAFSPESHRLYYSSGTTQLTLASFRPQVNESCYSDSLFVYDVYGRRDRALVLTKTFNASNAVRDETFIAQRAASNCTVFGDGQFNPCENIGECGDTPLGSIFRTNTTSFLAVYSSVNVTGGLRFRGFVLTSVTN
ncbi:unnamed protein product [Orchesella dallaii]|uniref:CUB domain-containing protein n=1 Tax=Orchesella dallaii TaxID=48710 RepID=A0ABP1PN99_9HEXA